MSNQDVDPGEVVFATGEVPTGVELMEPREVPLGGPRAMRVRRTLPQRHRSLIGAWCFVDHYGPDDVATSGGMSVAPHPHTGLQTVSWLFTGEIEHRDSAGNHALVRAGEVNLMTAGRGISHSEVSTADTDVLHGAQLWVALPDAVRDTEPGFQHHAPEPVRGPGWEARVFLGSVLGATSPVSTHTPLLGAEIMLAPGATLDIDIDAGFEHGVLVDTGVVGVAGSTTATRPNPASSPISRPDATASADGVRRGAGAAARRRAARRDDRHVVELRGPQPRGDRRLPGGVAGTDHRTRRRAAPARRSGRAREPGGSGVAVVGDGQEVRPGRFGIVIGEHLPPIPAPALPNARLKERR